MRHLETVNTSLEFAEHHFLLFPRRFLSHHTQRWDRALVSQSWMHPARGDTRGGLQAPLSCVGYSHIYTFPKRLSCCLHCSTPSTDQHAAGGPVCCTCAVPSLAVGQGGAAFGRWGCSASGAASGNIKPCVAAAGLHPGTDFCRF